MPDQGSRPASSRYSGPSAVDQRPKIAAGGDDSQNGPGDGYPRRCTAFTGIDIVFHG